MLRNYCQCPNGAIQRLALSLHRGRNAAMAHWTTVMKGTVTALAGPVRGDKLRPPSSKLGQVKQCLLPEAGRLLAA